MSVKDAFKDIQSGKIWDTLSVIDPWPSTKVLELVKGDGKQRLPIINEEKCLEQCGDFEFAVELIGEFLSDQAESAVEKIGKAIKANDHAGFMGESHSVKGVARNLYLTALSTVTTEMDSIGKILSAHYKAEAEKVSPCPCGACKNGWKIDDVLAARDPLLGELCVEIDRLKKHLPHLEELAEEEDEEDDDDEYE